MIRSLRIAAIALLVACGSLKDALPEKPGAAPDAGGPDASPSSSGGRSDTGDDDDDDGGADAGGREDAGPCHGPCVPEVVSAAENPPGPIVVDTKNVYFATIAVAEPESGVWVCPKSGCGDHPRRLGMGNPIGIAVLGGMVYWADILTSRIVACPIEGCNEEPTPIATGELDARGVWTDGIRIVWLTAADGGAIRYCEAASCTPKTVRANLGTLLTNVLVDQGQVVWSNFSATYACAITNCASPLALGVKSSANAAYGGRLFSVDRPKISECAITGCNQMPLLFATSPDPVSLTMDGTYLFWRDANDKAIYRCSSGGCAGGIPTTIATGQEAPGSAALTTDGLYLYWGTDTKIMRVRKAP